MNNKRKMKKKKKKESNSPLLSQEESPVPNSFTEGGLFDQGRCKDENQSDMCLRISHQSPLNRWSFLKLFPAWGMLPAINIPEIIKIVSESRYQHGNTSKAMFLYLYQNDPIPSQNNEFSLFDVHVYCTMAHLPRSIISFS
jgi:hypothetical protein